MIVLSNSAAQVIPAGGTVTFNVTVQHTGCDRNGCGGSEYHRTGSGITRLRVPQNRCCKQGIFDMSFNGNVSNGTAGTEVQLAIAVDGAALPETTMVETVGTANLFVNMGTRTYVNVCPGETVSVTVVNNGTSAVTLDANSVFTARRVA